jgi:molecular chaperone GrpE
MGIDSNEGREVTLEPYPTTLARRQVQIIEATGTELDRDLCQIVDTQINPALTAPVVTKVVRRGFKIGEHLLRPVEVTIDAPG